MKKRDFEKYVALLKFFKIFFTIKKAIPGVRNDYYSSKTFDALKNSPADLLEKASKILWSMFREIMKVPSKSKEEVDGRVVEFMIIPRFLISREKIRRLVADEGLQEDLGRLVLVGFLGHYNNESNKKFPEEEHMLLVRPLMRQRHGKDKYKKIGSINHGGKFARHHPQEYRQLYAQSLPYLTYLDQELKKGRPYHSIKQTLEEMPREEEEVEESADGDVVPEYPLTIGDYLVRKEEEERLLEIGPPLTKSQSCMEPVLKSKSKVRKFNSLPMSEMEERKPFKMKRYSTVQLSEQECLEKNIILVPPPEEPEDDE